MIFQLQAPDEELLQYVDRWVDLLVDRDYQTAYDAVAHRAGPHAWTPELIAKVINGYGLPEPHPCGEVFHVTPRHGASGKQHYREVDRDDIHAPNIAEIWYDLPLNGEWSDLTVTFLLQREVGGAKMVLDQIHVF